jgi:hypothetical protein
MAATTQAGALVKARISGKQGTHKIRVREVSETELQFVHEWTSKGETVQGKKAYTLPLTAVEVVEVLDPKPAETEQPAVEEPKQEAPQERPRRGRKATAAA